MPNTHRSVRSIKAHSSNRTSAFYEMMDVMGIAVWEFDLNYRVIRHNQKAKQIYGNDILGHYCYFLAAKRDSICPNCPAKLVYDGQESGRSQHGRIDASGKKIYIDHIATAIKDEKGNLTGVLVLIIDITAHKQLEKDLTRHRDKLEEMVKQRTKALKKNEEKYRSLYEKSEKNKALYVSLLNSSADAVAVYDIERKLQYINQSFTDTFGWSIEELNEKKIPYIPETEQKSTTNEMIRVLETGIPSRNFMTKRYTKDGRILDINLSASRYDNHEGNPAGLMVILKDITKIKATELMIQQAQKMEMLGTLAGGIAHDFNNILSGIFGFSQLAKMNLGDPEKTQDNINQIIKGAQKATDLVQQILAVSRKSTQAKCPVSVYNIVKEALKLLRATIPATIEIEEEIISKATVMSDPTKIHQIIMNLCTNAYQAMNETGGRMHLSLKEIIISQADCISDFGLIPGRYLDLKISDTGHGMDSITLEKIFDPYFTTKEPGKGTGLGLAVVFGLVKEFKGHITVHSKVDQGSTFHVYLPISEKSTAIHAPEREDKELSIGKETILFVDDEDALRTIAHQILERLGYTVHTCSSGITALETYIENPDLYDLVITDMTMPGMTGLELSQKILQLRPGQRILLCTGFSEKVDRKKALAMGIAEYLEKPFIVNDLAKVIRKVIEVL